MSELIFNLLAVCLVSAVCGYWIYRKGYDDGQNT